MINNFTPSQTHPDISTIDFRNLAKNKNKRYLMFDLDNTLFPHGKYYYSEYLKQLFSSLRELDYNPIIVTRDGYYLYIKSLYAKFHPNMAENSNDRFLKIMQLLELEKIYLNVKKHRLESFRKIMMENEFKLDESVMIGNWPEDIWAPNRLGIYTIAVKKAPPKNLTLELTL